MGTLAIIDYGSGNLRSAEKAFRRMSAERGLDTEIVVTNDPEQVRSAERIVLPGVGAYADCREGLAAAPGLEDSLREAVEREGKPFLGICVGMQLMSSRGLEKTITQGLDWIEGDVEPIVPADPSLKIPQIGWNTIRLEREHPLFAGIQTGEDGLHAYFVHSYHLVSRRPDQVIATTDYGGPVTAFVAHGNTAGAQFHPEKSQRLGLELIGNFLTWTP